MSVTKSKKFLYENHSLLERYIIKVSKDKVKDRKINRLQRIARKLNRIK